MCIIYDENTDFTSIKVVLPQKVLHIIGRIAVIIDSRVYRITFYQIKILAILMLKRVRSVAHLNENVRLGKIKKKKEYFLSHRKLCWECACRSASQYS